MRQRTGLAVTASVSVPRTQRRHVRSLITILPTLLIGIALITTTHLAIGVGSSRFTDVMGGSRTFPDSGDAPNSSQCRQALKKVSSHGAKCEIARSFQGCRYDSGFINYVEFQYCQFPSPVVPTILMVRSNKKNKISNFLLFIKWIFEMSSVSTNLQFLSLSFYQHFIYKFVKKWLNMAKFMEDMFDNSKKTFLLSLVTCIFSRKF